MRSRIIALTPRRMRPKPTASATSETLVEALDQTRPVLATSRHSTGLRMATIALPSRLRTSSPTLAASGTSPSTDLRRPTTLAGSAHHKALPHLRLLTGLLARCTAAAAHAPPLIARAHLTAPAPPTVEILTAPAPPTVEIPTAQDLPMVETPTAQDLLTVATVRGLPTEALGECRGKYGTSSRQLTLQSLCALFI